MFNFGLGCLCQRIMKLKRSFALFLAVGLFTCSIFSQESQQNQSVSETAKTAMSRFTEQIRIFPQEKIYLHLDKPYYSAGEQIWLRAYLIHATMHIPLSLSRYVYVELINRKKEVVVRKKIHQTEKDLYFGQFDVPMDIEPGTYTVRAYTNFMRNLPEEFLFHHKLLITNNLESGKKRSETSSTSRTDKTETVEDENKSGSFDLQFFPEGGHLLTDSYQIVGFKALDDSGYGLNVKGKIVDKSGAEVATFESSHLGMGKLMFKPQSGETYKAIVSSSNGLRKTVDLPTASDNYYSLSIQQTPKRLSIQALTPGQQPRTEKLQLILCQRGLPVYQSSLDPESPGIALLKTNLGSGFFQVYLINNKLQILSERSLFILGNDFAELNLTLDKNKYSKRSPVRASIVLKDSKGNPVEGSFSVSVTDNNDVRLDSSASNIISYLLLESDLKGNIEKPGDYFRASNKEADKQLDLLMLTQGWRRYDAQAVLLGRYAKCDNFEVEQGPVISGLVRYYPSRRPMSDNNVSLLLTGKSVFFDAIKSDKNGRFAFKCPDFSENTKIRIEAAKSEFQAIELVVHPDSFPKINAATLFSDKAVFQEKQIQSFIKKSKEKWSIENGSPSISLKEVEVTGKRLDSHEQIRKDRGATYSDPSYTIDQNDIVTSSTIYDALCKAPGVYLNSEGTGVLLRNSAPLVLVDGIEYNMEDLSTIQPSEVQMIDILKDLAQTNLYGENGNSGVIHIYLKRGLDVTREELDLGSHQAIVKPLGYTQPVEFYVPKYQVEENRKSNLPDLRTTIFWQPNVKSNAKGEAELSFFTADESGTYTITAEGITPKGEIIHYEGTLNRK
jgi:hypothetical protein